MGSIEDTSANTTNKIPVIDLASFTSSSGTKEARHATAKELVQGCREVGFVYLTNHGVPQKQLDDAFAMSKRLFNLTSEEKEQAAHPPGTAHHRGWTHIGLEQVSKTAAGDKQLNARFKMTDWKETYEIGSEANEAQPNIWLPDSTLPGFKDLTTELFWEFNTLARLVLAALADGIGLTDPEVLLKHHAGDNNQLRLAHYPPVSVEEVNDFSKSRCGTHCDFGTITLLAQDDVGGLEVEDPHAYGRFMPATPVPGALVLNIADCLMRWSNDELKSTKHRVAFPAFPRGYSADGNFTLDRYSIPYFVSPEMSTLIECLPSCVDAEHPAKYKPVTLADIVHEKFGTAYD